MSLQKLIDSINAMPSHDDIDFFCQNLDLIARELAIEFRVLDDEAQDGGVEDDSWCGLDD